MKISDVRALVTGGTSGIGFEIAKQLKAKGGDVVICGRDASKLRESASAIGAHGIRADVSVESEATALVRQTIAHLPDYNVLINNAGFGSFAPLLDTDLAAMQNLFATNVFGAMVVARESARHFIAKKRGNIVNMSSSAGVRGFAGGTAYAASKFAVSGMTECWRAELRKHDIRVMQINPSEVQTDFFRGGRPQSDRKLRAEEIAHAALSMLEMDDRGFITELSVWATNPD
ncbi:MAG: 3-oxoacyl-[acyl-carrier protein] reductase [Thermoanaerobaculia bacterium]|jgi:3-oxoacyl-[acyl-carrier protein] reductase|nr:3-oxoacyl-[acyl-carrier protein] reductase [Thermoanaerobaculia bacterium]